MSISIQLELSEISEIFKALDDQSSGVSNMENFIDIVAQGTRSDAEETKDLDHIILNLFDIYNNIDNDLSSHGYTNEGLKMILDGIETQIYNSTVSGFGDNDSRQKILKTIEYTNYFNGDELILTYMYNNIANFVKDYGTSEMQDNLAEKLSNAVYLFTEIMNEYYENDEITSTAERLCKYCVNGLRYLDDHNYTVETVACILSYENLSYNPDDMIDADNPTDSKIISFISNLTTSEKLDLIDQVETINYSCNIIPELNEAERIIYLIDDWSYKTFKELYLRETDSSDSVCNSKDTDYTGHIKYIEFMSEHKKLDTIIYKNFIQQTKNDIIRIINDIDDETNILRLYQGIIGLYTSDDTYELMISTFNLFDDPLIYELLKDTVCNTGSYIPITIGQNLRSFITYLAKTSPTTVSKNGLSIFSEYSYICSTVLTNLMSSEDDITSLNVYAIMYMIRYNILDQTSIIRHISVSTRPMRSRVTDPGNQSIRRRRKPRQRRVYDTDDKVSGTNTDDCQTVSTEYTILDLYKIKNIKRANIHEGLDTINRYWKLSIPIVLAANLTAQDYRQNYNFVGGKYQKIIKTVFLINNRAYDMEYQDDHDIQDTDMTWKYVPVEILDKIFGYLIGYSLW
jgi:hypothetical protein